MRVTETLEQCHEMLRRALQEAHTQQQVEGEGRREWQKAQRPERSHSFTWQEAVAQLKRAALAPGRVDG